jgi:hypothetical protein
MNTGNSKINPKPRMNSSTKLIKRLMEITAFRSWD